MSSQDRALHHQELSDRRVGGKLLPAGTASEGVREALEKGAGFDSSKKRVSS